MFYEQKFLFSLLFSLIFETSVVILLIKHFFKYRLIKASQIIFTGIFATTLTLPYLWFVLPKVLLNRSVFIITGESLVIFIESLIYYQILKLKYSQAFIISFIANLTSIILGLLLI